MRRHPELLRLLVVTGGRLVCVVAVAVAASSTTRGSGDRGGRSWVWLVATLLVAAAVSLTRAPLERLADRVAFGRDGDPHAVLSGFVQRIADTLAVDDVLPHVARTVTQAVHSDRGEVRLWLADGEQWRQTWPPNGPAGLRTELGVPLQHHGEQVGELNLALAGAELTPQDRDLLDRLAGTAGLALANVRLAYDLRRRLSESVELAGRLELSRQRLLDAAAQQTRRFSHRVEVQVLSRLHATRAALDRVEAGDLSAAEEARDEATAALAALRELASGVFPPALADRGLADALQGYAARYDGLVRLTTTAGDARAPLPVETGAYFCAVQLVEDAVSGGAVALRLQQDEGSLELVVESASTPDPETLQLVTDRVEASNGLVGVDSAPTGAASTLPTTVTLTWTRRPGDPVWSGAHADEEEGVR